MRCNVENIFLTFNIYLLNDPVIDKKKHDCNKFTKNKNVPAHLSCFCDSF